MGGTFDNAGAVGGGAVSTPGFAWLESGVSVGGACQVHAVGSWRPRLLVASLLGGGWCAWFLSLLVRNVLFGWVGLIVR